MSLVSASSFVGGLKEYMYRGVQQLPLILTMITFLFSITTGSIGHTTLFTGLAFVMPLFTLASQLFLGKVLNKFFPDMESQWKRSRGDTCNIITDYNLLGKLPYYIGQPGVSTPSFWITSIGFFFGYVFANVSETLKEQPVSNANTMAYEKRVTTATYIAFSASIFFILLLVVRFVYMGSCEGGGAFGKTLGVMFMVISGLIGWGFYDLSIKCGARSSDLLGILSQILPASATSTTPTVCLAS
jgi:hypothetical protein